MIEGLGRDWKSMLDPGYRGQLAARRSAQGLQGGVLFETFRSFVAFAIAVIVPLAAIVYSVVFFSVVAGVNGLDGTARALSDVRGQYIEDLKVDPADLAPFSRRAVSMWDLGEENDLTSLSRFKFQPGAPAAGTNAMKSDAKTVSVSLRLLASAWRQGLPVDVESLDKVRAALDRLDAAAAAPEMREANGDEQVLVWRLFHRAVLVVVSGEAGPADLESALGAEMEKNRLLVNDITNTKRRRAMAEMVVGGYHLRGLLLMGRENFTKAVEAFEASDSAGALFRGSGIIAGAGGAWRVLGTAESLTGLTSQDVQESRIEAVLAGKGSEAAKRVALREHVRRGLTRARAEGGNLSDALPRHDAMLKYLLDPALDENEDSAPEVRKGEDLAELGRLARASVDLLDLPDSEVARAVCVLSHTGNNPPAFSACQAGDPEAGSLLDTAGRIQRLRQEGFRIKKHRDDGQPSGADVLIAIPPTNVPELERARSDVCAILGKAEDIPNLCEGVRGTSLLARGLHGISVFNREFGDVWRWVLGLPLAASGLKSFLHCLAWLLAARAGRRIVTNRLEGLRSLRTTNQNLNTDAQATSPARQDPGAWAIQPEVVSAARQAWHPAPAGGS